MIYWEILILVHGQDEGHLGNGMPIRNARKGRIDPSTFDDDGVYLAHAWAGSRARLNSITQFVR